MQLSARLLRDVAGVNNFRYTERLALTEGDTVSIYFQLIDRDLDLPTEGFVPPGRRYAPAATTTLQVVLESVDMAKKVTRTVTQPWGALDASIWLLSITNSDKVRGTVTMSLVMTEPGGKVTRGVLQPALSVLPVGAK